MVSVVATISLSSFTSNFDQGTGMYNNTSHTRYVEVRGLKCPSHDYVKDGHHFMYKEVYPHCYILWKILQLRQEQMGLY